MIEQFYNADSIISGILKIFVLLAVGYLFSTRKLLKKEGIDGLNTILLWACLPALMISKITSTFEPSAFPYWWFLPLCSIAMSALGLFIGYIALKFFKDFSSRREFMSACAFQNCGYLPIALIAFTCKGAFCDRMLVYIFLFIIGFNMSMWSFAPVFLSKSPKENFKLSSILNPPFVSTVFSVITVFVIGKEWVPSLVYDPLKVLGEATFPLVLIMLGAYLAEHKGYKLESWKALSGCLFAKLIILPLLVLAIVQYSRLDITYKFFLFLEATMPTAVSLIIIGHYKGADNKFFSGMIFYSHLLAIIIIPIWLMVFEFLSQ